MSGIVDKRVILDADPNALNFYKRHGLSEVGKLKSSIKNRFLPKMAKDLKSVKDEAQIN